MVAPICPVCRYNLPHHDSRCADAAPLVFLCADHAPRRSAANDDSLTLRPCAVCATSTRKAYRSDEVR